MISVILPTRDRRKLLEQALEAILAQDIRMPFEVIVVNDGSRDGSRQYLDTHEARGRQLVVVHHQTSLGKSSARNAGIKAAKGDIVAFSDDDMVVDNSWLEMLTAPLSTGQAVCAFGETVYVGDGKQHYFPERIVANPGARFPMGGNIAYRRSIFDQIGGFDKRFDAYANEDTELALRAVPLGRFEAVPQARARHAPSRWSIETLKKSANNAAVWPILLRERRAEMRRASFALPVYGRIIYPLDLLVLLVSPLLIPIILCRYLAHGQRDFRLFFAKWPLLLVRRRLLIWREAIRQRTFAL